MTPKRRIGLASIISLACLFSFPCFADEILFQNQRNLQTGVVVGEDNESVTIRFPRDAIKSITRSGKESSTSLRGKVIWEEGRDYLILKIPRRRRPGQGAHRRNRNHHSPVSPGEMKMRSGPKDHPRQPQEPEVN